MCLNKHRETNIPPKKRKEWVSPSLNDLHDQFPRPWLWFLGRLPEGLAKTRRRSHKISAETRTRQTAIYQHQHTRLHFVHQAKAELAILQQNPGAVQRRGVHGANGHGFLPLPQGNNGRWRELVRRAGKYRRAQGNAGGGSKGHEHTGGTRSGRQDNAHQA